MDSTPTTTRSADGTVIGYRSLGAGQPVIVIGGALRAAADYIPFARELARQFEVHVVDRRGRGASGPLGAGYSMESECEDVLAVQAATGARRAFGHSYGGLVVIEAAARAPVFTQLALYEPAVSVDGSIPTTWLDEYTRRLGAGDRRGAFAAFVRQSGHAPAALTHLPAWYVRAVLRFAVHGRRWRTIDPLLEANGLEHREVGRLDGSLARYSGIDATVALLVGSKSPQVQTSALRRLQEVVPDATLEVLPGLDHNAPDEKAPPTVAAAVCRVFVAASESRAAPARAELGAVRPTAG